jgi:hypothetical protein
MNSHQTLYVMTLALLIVCGCGSGGFNANNVTVTISPAAVAIPENGQVSLQAMVNNLCQGCAPIIQLWSVTENNLADCNWVDTPPAGPCPGGTIQIAGTGNSLVVTYFAPNTAGTFHVTADWVTVGLSKVGTSVITVTP